MNPLIFDLIVLVLCIGLIAGAAQQGFVKAAGGLVAFLVSLWAAAYGAPIVEEMIGFNLFARPLFFLVVFLVLALIVNKILGIAVFALDSVRKLLSFLPLVGIVNTMLGGVVGVLQAGLAVLALGWFVLHVPTATVLPWQLPAADTSVSIRYGIQGYCFLVNCP